MNAASIFTQDIVMFLFDERNPCTFRGISVYLGFVTQCIGARDLSTSVMNVVVADNIVGVLSHVLEHQTLSRGGVLVASQYQVAAKTADEQ